MLCVLTAEFGRDQPLFTFFSQQSDCQRNTEDPIIKTLLKILVDSGNCISDVCVLVPSLGAVVSRIFPLLSYGKLFARLQEHLRHLVETRKKASAKVPDIVQLLLEARKEPTPTDDIEQEVKTCAEMPFNTKLNTGFVTDTHIVSNCFLFLVSGFESTSATLAFTLYELATHPEEQWRLYRELMASFPVHKALTYEDLKVLNRFDAVIKETLLPGGFEGRQTLASCAASSTRSLVCSDCSCDCPVISLPI